MSIREINREEWVRFFDEFSRHYRGRSVTIQILGKHLGVYSIARRQPLVGITAELKQGATEIELIVGDTLEAHLTHVIADPTRIWIEQVSNGEDTSMQIESASGTAVLVEFGEQVGTKESAPRGMLLQHT